MALENPQVVSRAGVAQAAIDEGLRGHMLRIYNYMAMALALTGGVAAAVASSPAAMQAIYGSGLVWVVMLAPLGFVMALSFGINRMSATTAQLLFWAYAATMGLSMASIFIVFTGTSIARVFFISASVFLAMSLYGYTTKRSLAGFGSFLVMGVIGLLIASVVNLFLASSGLQFALSVVGVLIFTGLTAYDTQKLKEIYLASDGQEIAGKKAVMGALTLYLDFILIFQYLLYLMGDRR